MRTPEELELQLADLETLFGELVTLVDDPELTDEEFREEVRTLVEDEEEAE